jgi:hypothetical protein
LVKIKKGVTLLKKFDTKKQNMDFQFLEDFKKLSIICPPAQYRQKKMTAYRWVFDEITDQNNFTPRWYILAKGNK